MEDQSLFLKRQLSFAGLDDIAVVSEPVGMKMGQQRVDAAERNPS